MVRLIEVDGSHYNVDHIVKVDSICTPPLPSRPYFIIIMSSGEHITIEGSKSDIHFKRQTLINFLIGTTGDMILKFYLVFK